MFSFGIGEPMKVSFASQYKKQDGTKGAYIKCLERDNQPADAEYVSKSKAYVIFFVDELPSGVVNGSFITFESISHIDMKHVPVTDQNGNKLVDCYGRQQFETALVVVADGITVYPPEEKASKKTSKKS